MRFGEHTVNDLPKLGKPILRGEALPCRFCGSILLVLHTCHRYVGRKSLKEVPEHIHVRCGDCKAIGPSVKLGPRARELALWAWTLYAPSPDLASRLWNPRVRKSHSSKEYRGRRKFPRIEPCSFCGSAWAWLLETGVLNYRMYVACDHCGAEGPWATNKPDARILWNQAYTFHKKWISGFALKPVKHTSEIGQGK